MSIKQTLPAILCLVTTYLIVFASVSYGQSFSANINATVKISVCGNDIIEGGEDCEAGNINGRSCVTQGYGGGDLSCDIACTFDVTACTASLSPTPTSTPTPTESPGSTAAIDDSLPPTETPSPPVVSRVPVSTRAIDLNAGPQSLLPEALRFYDITGNGKILVSELPQVIRLWLDQVKAHKRCDVNGDGQCDIRDFSVLMYYVEQ